MTEIVPYEETLSGEVLPPSPGVDELIEKANHEHGLVEEALGQALNHVISAGEALTELRAQFGTSGGWDKWAEANFNGGRVVASYYMRIYEYREMVQGLPNVSQAMKSLRGMPALRRPTGSPTAYSEDIREEARALASTGMTKIEISRILDVNRHTVARWVDPKILQRHREKTKEQSRLQREERLRNKAEAERRAAEREARRVGGSLAEAYSLVHKLEAPLAIAAREATDPEVRKLLTEAIRSQHHTLDHIVRALGAS